jgi:starvation-inducible DNA-binding protein
MKKQMGIPTTIQPEIGISTDDRALSSSILNTLLASEFVVLTQTLNYHWNLVGPEFHDYHLLFDKHYREIFSLIDDIAERVRALGSIALGTLKEFIHSSRIREDEGDIPAPRDMVFRLLVNHEVIIRSIREGINLTGENNKDMGTNNFLAETIEKHEKMAWMLRSLLERGSWKGQEET